MKRDSGEKPLWIEDSMTESVVRVKCEQAKSTLIVFMEKIIEQFKIVVEKHLETYFAFPLGIKGVVVGQKETYEATLADIKSAINSLSILLVLTK